MIILTRLGGREMAVNPDLIERAEPTPDTVITMIDGHKLVVAESVAEVVELVRSWRAGVAAEAFAISRPEDDPYAHPADAADPVAGGARSASSRRAEGMAAHPAMGPGAAMGRVLHLPSREE